MADPISQFDNDFEQLEHKEAEDINSLSKEHQEPEPLEPQEISHIQEIAASREGEPLISFGDAEEAAVVEQQKEEPKHEVVEPVPTPVPTPVAAPVAAPVSPPSVKTEGQSCHCCCSFENMDPRVKDVLLWRDIKKSGAVFASCLSLLLSLAMFSIISVIAYSALIALTITITFRIYKMVMGTVQKSTEAHPFKNYLEFDLSLNKESVHDYADVLVAHVQKVSTDLRHYLLIEDMVDSLKFALFLWVLTYIGSWFNGMTLIILGVIGAFCIPKVYDMHKELIDQYLGVACGKIHDTCSMVREKIPFLGKKKQE